MPGRFKLTFVDRTASEPRVSRGGRQEGAGRVKPAVGGARSSQVGRYGILSRDFSTGGRGA